MSKAAWLSTSIPAFLVLILFSIVPAAAQDGPRLAVFGGYTYWRADTKPLGFQDATELAGGKVSALFNLTPNFGVVGEIGGGWSNALKSYDAAIGPQISYPRGNLTFFGQVLFGKSKTRVAIPNFPNGGQTNTGTAFTGGGGLDYALGPRFSIRLAQADYLRSRAFGTDIGNIRVSTGIVYRFGRVKARRPEKLPAP